MPGLIGQTISHYKVLEKLGSGGMGTVYKAQDQRLDRFVALKFLPSHLSGGDDRRRFVHEAKAASSLDHPNICTVYEIDEADDSLFIAMSLCEGETLKSRIRRGPLKIEEAIDLTIQIASGLARAHSKGIVHRDIKPANLIVTPEGQIKIVDFGLARFSGQSRLTQAGRTLGTAAYMSPEQLRGGEVDHRTDIWSLGVVFYEMITGRLPFPEDAEPATFYAILAQEPEPLTALRTGVPVDLDRIVAKMLAKNPLDRYQHVDEIPVDLRAIRRSGGSRSTSSMPTVPDLPLSRLQTAPTLPSMATAAAVPVRPAEAPARSWLRPPRVLLVAALAAGLALAGFAAGRLLVPGVHSVSQPPTFKLLTFRRGTVRTARFAPDGHTIVYGAAWDGQPIQIYLTRPESPQSTVSDLPPAEVLALAGSGEMAVSLGHTFEDGLMGQGTLARAPLLGGAPRQILENVREADWMPDGSTLAVIRPAGEKERLELTAGKVLYETSGYLSHLRVSRDGEHIAFLDHPIRMDDRGAVTIVDLEGRKTTLSGGWFSLRGLAWSPEGDEVWFSGVRSGEGFALYAVDLKGRERPLLRAPGSMILLDVAPDGKVLLAREDQIRQVTSLAPGTSEERDISWLDLSIARDISFDGKTALLTHFGEGSGSDYSVYIRGTDGSPAVRLGAGEATSLSPDGKWAASLLHGPPSRIVLLPTGAGEPKTLTVEGITVSTVQWFADGRRLLLAGHEAGRDPRCWVLDLNGGRPRPVTPEGVSGDHATLRVSPDDRFVAAGAEGNPALYSIAGGIGSPPQPIAGLEPGEWPQRWSADGRSLYVARAKGIPLAVHRIDLATGRRELWTEIRPSDRGGLMPRIVVNLSTDGRSYVYNSQRLLHQLYLVEGLAGEPRG